MQGDDAMQTGGISSGSHILDNGYCGRAQAGKLYTTPGIFPQYTMMQALPVEKNHNFEKLNSGVAIIPLPINI
jgi:hypothetical protein